MRYRFLDEVRYLHFQCLNIIWLSGNQMHIHFNKNRIWWIINVVDKMYIHTTSINVKHEAFLWVLIEIKQFCKTGKSNYRGSPDSTTFALPGNRRTNGKIVLSGDWFSTIITIFSPILSSYYTGDRTKWIRTKRGPPVPAKFSKMAPKWFHSLDKQGFTIKLTNH